jgi:hypothetical protein
MKKSLLIASMLATMSISSFAAPAATPAPEKVTPAAVTQKAAPVVTAKATPKAKKEKASKLYTKENRYRGGNDGYTLPNGESLGT